MDCLFCKIANKTLPSQLVYENEQILAFRDIMPQAPHHVLIIPKRHIESLNALTEDDATLMGEIVLASQAIAKILGIDKTGYRLVSNCGPDANQTVFHIHFHVIGGRTLQWPPG